MTEPKGSGSEQRTRLAEDRTVLAAERERLGFIPTSQTVSNLCFGGPDGRRLFMAATKQLLAIDLLT